MMTRHMKTGIVMALAVVAGISASAQQEPVDAAANVRNAGRIEAGGSLPVLVVPAGEEAWIAAATRRLISGRGR